MKKLSLFTRVVTPILFASLVIIGCKKENSDTLTPQQEEEAVTASSEAEAENEVIFNDVFDNVMGVSPQVAVGGTGIFERANTSSVIGNGRELGLDSVPSCVHVSFTQLEPGHDFPLKIVIDFG